MLKQLKNALLHTACMAVLLFCLSGCATGFYVASQFSEPQRQVASNAWPIGNILHCDFLLWHETWNGPEDYVLPPWLDRSLNSACIVLDMPISFVFDVATVPWQIYCYCFPPKVIAVQNLRLENPVRYYRVELRQQKQPDDRYEISAFIIDVSTRKTRLYACGVIGKTSSLEEAIRRYGNIKNDTQKITMGEWEIPLANIVFNLYADWRRRT